MITLCAAKTAEEIRQVLSGVRQLITTDYLLIVSGWMVGLDVDYLSLWGASLKANLFSALSSQFQRHTFEVQSMSAWSAV